MMEEIRMQKRIDKFMKQKTLKMVDEEAAEKE